MPSSSTTGRSLVVRATLLALLATPAAGEGWIAAGDAAWERRAEGRRGAAPAEAPIGEAIAAYETALDADPTDLEARWKLMRALFFHGEHVVGDVDRQLEIFDRGRELGGAGLDQIGGADSLLELDGDRLRSAVDDPVVAAELFFWNAVHWGLWGRTRGKIASARQGVAGRIRDYARAATELAPAIENGGGHRILGRLHTEAPKIPFVTGWIDRQVAIRELEHCLEIAPADLTTRLYLAEALVEYSPERRAEGIAMLRAVVADEPDPRWLIEELAAKDDARVLLARLDGAR